MTGRRTALRARNRELIAGWPSRRSRGERADVGRGLPPSSFEGDGTSARRGCAAGAHPCVRWRARLRCHVKRVAHLRLRPPGHALCCDAGLVPRGTSRRSALTLLKRSADDGAAARRPEPQATPRGGRRRARARATRPRSGPAAVWTHVDPADKRRRPPDASAQTRRPTTPALEVRSTPTVLGVAANGTRPRFATHSGRTSTGPRASGVVPGATTRATRPARDPWTRFHVKPAVAPRVCLPSVVSGVPALSWFHVKPAPDLVQTCRERNSPARVRLRDSATSR